MFNRFVLLHQMTYQISRWKDQISPKINVNQNRSKINGKSRKRKGNYIL